VKAATLALLLLTGCAGAGRGGDAEPPIGHAARAYHGAEPLAAPPSDAGQAEDPKAS
jgi:hypothetical protein